MSIWLFVGAVGAMSAFILALSRQTERRRGGRSRRSLVPKDGDGSLAANSDGWVYLSQSTGSETFSSEHHSSEHHSNGCNASDGGTSGSLDHGEGGGGGATEVVGATVAMGRRWPRAATETTAVLI